MLYQFSNYDNILFSDVSHFHTNGHGIADFGNSENPKAKHEKPLHSPKVTVRAAISANRVMNPYLFFSKILAAI